jgi:hypothetical protein
VAVTVRTLAAHEVVRATFPRPVTAADEIGMAAGTAIDDTLSHFSHEVRDGRRPTFSAMQRWAADVFDRQLSEADVSLSAEQTSIERLGIEGVLRAFRQTEIMGMARPRSRLVLINEEVGVYAQPDFWDGRDRFFEMKSYRAVPPPPDVELQLRLFQLAFPGFRAFLACFDRHARPVTTTIVEVPRPVPERAEAVLRLAYRTGLAVGVPKVREYLDAPTVRYPRPPDDLLPG